MNKKIISIINNKILKALDNNIVPWHQPWKNGILNQNFHSKHTYTGINELLTNCSDFSSPFWLTFNQIKQLGGHVIKGSESTPIVYYSLIKKEDNPTIEKDYFLMKCYRVFNLDQIQGIKKESIHVDTSTTPCLSCDNFIDSISNKPKIINKNGSKCFYQPLKDTIFMVNQSQFFSSYEYYSVLFHELIHSTGHKSRLNRKTVSEYTRKGSSQYAIEELTAEIGANYLSKFCNIDSHINFNNSVSYINSWKRVIQTNPHAFLIASQRAQKAVNFLLNLSS